MVVRTVVRSRAPRFAACALVVSLLSGCGSHTNSASRAAAAASGAAASAAASGPRTTRLFGDLNGSGGIDPGDATKVLRAVVGLDPPPANVLTMDYNGSGTVDPGDATKLLRLVVGLDAPPLHPGNGAGAPDAATMGYLRGVMDQFHRTVDVYTDANAAGNHFAARGTLNPGSALAAMDEAVSTNPHSGLTCIRASYAGTGDDWNGWYFLNGVLQGTDTAPALNWGTVANAGYNLTGATTLSFWARGEHGGERVRFLCGGVGRDAASGAALQPYPDSCVTVTTDFVTLTSTWQRYTLSLAGQNLSAVLGGFGWVTNAPENAGRPIVFYLDDVAYNRSRLSEPRFLQSYRTQVSALPVDQVLSNVAFSYDNAMALLAFLADFDLTRAGQVATALVTATQHDRYHAAPWLRNGYQAGDLLLPPGWTPNGHAGTVRMAGWYDGGQATWLEDGYQVSRTTGSDAWVILALVAYHDVTGDAAALAAATALAENVAQRCRANSGAGGYTGGTEGPDPAPHDVTWRSTEHNLDLYAAFTRLARATGNAVWTERANHARAFVVSQWRAADGRFQMGTQDDGVTPNDTVVPLDVQAWAILALGSGATPYRAALDYAEAHHRVGVGYDFNTDRDGIWGEGSAQMAAAWTAVGQPDRAAAIRTGLEALRVNGGLPAANRDGLTTGLTQAGAPWLYYRREHVGATAWLALAEARVNPFWLGTTVP